MDLRCLIGWHDFTVPKYHQPDKDEKVGVWTHICKRCGKLQEVPHD